MCTFRVRSILLNISKMKTGGDFRDHLVDLTDHVNKPDSNIDKQSQRKSSPGRMKLEKWLHSSMKIEMTDGRTLVGSFVCTDRDNNIILGSCTEHLRPDVCLVGFTCALLLPFGWP
ncbi:uncharacterized protein Sbat isoform X2 [Panulirus ornatus]|uniref:uncharacterized protein Sbat isoform X2 n=1 Tax=Panulirus ornatus TaxID=150431 RepID=UPI003A847F75